MLTKKIASLLAFTIIVAACEKDDFCSLNPVTPNLVLRFYDKANRESTKKVDSLYVWAEGKDSIFVNESKDSIGIPLNSLATETVYNLSAGTLKNKFTISYTVAEKYVSRSCGFRIIFNEVTFASDSTWIKDFTPITPITIDQQNSAHVQIFH